MVVVVVVVEKYLDFDHFPFEISKNVETYQVQSVEI